MSPLITVKELCARTGLSKTTVYEMTRDGKLPHYRFGAAVRYDWEEVKAQHASEKPKEKAA